MENVQEFMNSENLDMTHILSHKNPENWKNNTGRIINRIYQHQRKIKWWDLHTKKLKYRSSEKNDEHNNNFGKVWSPGYNLLNGTYTLYLPTIKIDIPDKPLIKDDIFEATVTFTPNVNPTGIITYYYEHHNITCIYQ